MTPPQRRPRSALVRASLATGVGAGAAGRSPDGGQPHGQPAWAAPPPGPLGSETLTSRCGLVVLVNQAAEPVPPPDSTGERGSGRPGWAGAAGRRAGRQRHRGGWRALAGGRRCGDLGRGCPADERPAGCGQGAGATGLRGVRRAGHRGGVAPLRPRGPPALRARAQCPRRGPRTGPAAGRTGRLAGWRYWVAGADRGRQGPVGDSGLCRCHRTR